MSYLACPQLFVFKKSLSLLWSFHVVSRLHSRSPFPSIAVGIIQKSSNILSALSRLCRVAKSECIVSYMRFKYEKLKKCVRIRGSLSLAFCCCFDKTRTSYHHPTFNGDGWEREEWFSHFHSILSWHAASSRYWQVINCLE